LTELPAFSRIEKDSNRVRQSAGCFLSGCSLPSTSQISPSITPHRSRRALLSVSLAALMVAAISAGCGRATYELRLEESRRYFTYLEKLNQNLGPIITGKGVQIRVPKQFEVIPGPIPKKKDPKKADKKGSKDSDKAADKGADKDAAKDAPKDPPADADDPEEERDPRQPKYADITFPGLQLAFSSDLSVGGKAHQKGYLYVLTNGDLLGKRGSDEKAAAFNNTVIHTIAQAVGQPDPPPEKMTNDAVPKGEAWVTKRTFKVVRPGFPASIEGKDYRIDIYNCKQEKNEVTFVYVLPENVSPAERLSSNIDLSLETLHLTKIVPSAKSASGKAVGGLGL
jgi:hypothetical protein